MIETKKLLTFLSILTLNRIEGEGEGEENNLFMNLFDF